MNDKYGLECLDVDDTTNEFMGEVFQHCISIDAETTGVNPERNGIVSIGACTFKNRQEFYLENKIREDAEVDAYALSINGFSVEEINNQTKCSEYESLVELINFATQNDTFIIVGQNPRFDYEFIKAIWVRNGNDDRKFPFSYRLIDVSGLVIASWIQARNIIPPKGISSGFVSNVLDVIEEPKPHNALTGAKMNKLHVYSWINQYCVEDYRP